jgi:tetratricopeptide (TPR) repeat protein
VVPLGITYHENSRGKKQNRHLLVIALTKTLFYSGKEIAAITLGKTTMTVTTLNPGEEAQLKQTIEMFEVIVQSQPNDCQSLEILKEAYTKLGREPDVIRISKRIAEAYTQMGQLSSAILEYETVLQRQPNDVEVQTALRQIENQAGNSAAQSTTGESVPQGETARFNKKALTAQDGIDDGRKMMQKIFVESKVISAGDFDLCWHTLDLAGAQTDVAEPFIQVLGDKKILAPEKSLKLLADKSRMAFLPFERYDADMDLLRGFPADVCRRWCVAPFDRMSKSILVATANPFNQFAAKELAEATSHRLLWYLTTPTELVQTIRKAFR